MPLFMKEEHYNLVIKNSTLKRYSDKYENLGFFPWAHSFIEPWFPHVSSSWIGVIIIHISYNCSEDNDLMCGKPLAMFTFIAQ